MNNNGKQQPFYRQRKGDNNIRRAAGNRNKRRFQGPGGSLSDAGHHASGYGVGQNVDVNRKWVSTGPDGARVSGTAQQISAHYAQNYENMRDNRAVYMAIAHDQYADHFRRVDAAQRLAAAAAAPAPRPAMPPHAHTQHQPSHSQHASSHHQNNWPNPSVYGQHTGQQRDFTAQQPAPLPREEIKEPETVSSVIHVDTSFNAQAENKPVSEAPASMPRFLTPASASDAGSVAAGASSEKTASVKRRGRPPKTLSSATLTEAE